MPATGRPFSGIPKELPGLQEIRYAVTANGARVIDMEKREVIVDELEFMSSRNSDSSTYGGGYAAPAAAPAPAPAAVPPVVDGSTSV